MNGPGNGDEIPDPIVEKVRNFADLPEQVRKEVADGAFLKIRDQEPVENAVSVSVLSGVLVHFDRLFRILQAVKGGIEVKRAGRVPEVVGAKHLAAFPAYAGSYALPLRLEAPQGELVGDDRGALESVMQLLADGDEASLQDLLSNLPERVGDELYALLRELVQGEAALTVEAVRDGQGTGEVEISPGAAMNRATWLKSLVESELASETIQGKLFRIDTKRGRIAVDSHEDDESVIWEATFPSGQLETLRRALNHEVEIDVEVVEEKRPYERTARNRIMSVVSVRQLAADDDEQAAADSADAARAAEAAETADAAEAEAPEADAAG